MEGEPHQSADADSFPGGEAYKERKTPQFAALRETAADSSPWQGSQR